jgi:hypothetical protein
MDNSPLRVLSGELRNIVYSYLWPDHEEVIICLCGSHHPMRSHLRNPKADEAWEYGDSHLPRVCRQLRHETLGYFYNVSSFVLPVTWVLLAGGQSKLEAQWRLFVQVFGVERIRQIKHMTVLAGKINKIKMTRLPGEDPTGSPTREYDPRKFELSSEVDLRCIFAKRDIRPCLHLAARMLVLVELYRREVYVRSQEKHLWIDFDDREATVASIRNAKAFEEWGHVDDRWARLWAVLVAQWYGDADPWSKASRTSLMLSDDESDDLQSDDSELEENPEMNDDAQARGLGSNDDDAEIVQT